MADLWQTESQTKSGAARSAVLDMDMEEMEMMDDGNSDTSDYDNNFHTMRQDNQGAGGKANKTFVDDIRQRMGENVTQMVWQAGTQGAKRAWTLYGNIDVLRPYFDVEPKEVQMRLLYSLIPKKPSDQRQQVPKELYGPTMVVLTLIAILLYQMKTAEHKVEEGTLMGSAIGVCFMYWLGASCVVWFVCYVCNVRITLLQILSMMGYALFGHCVVLFLGTVIHTSHDHMFFYLLWAGVGGLSTLRMAGIIMSRTRGKTERLIVIGTIAALHLLFLLYLHFAYHTIVEEISDALNQNLVPLPVANEEEMAVPVAGIKEEIADKSDSQM
ncbi:protein YIPF3-like isoform X2 [Physella acuta]|uniref:protein YIPF3-like isoform X2 n=1 Tax=Physella acuta TaxID=109671 RepID=UPI0027DDF9E1|nr:protein YIPF3-like isoform X2 [Physella acuta]